MKKLIVWMILSTFLLSGCVSGRMSGTRGDVVAGASIGGSVGSAIGGLIGENNHGWRGGYRGSAIGTIVGTVAGAAIGNAVSTPRNREEGYVEITEKRYNSKPQSQRPAQIPDLRIRNIRFIDTNRNHVIDAGENSKVIFEVVNEGRTPVYDIVPTVEEITGMKNIYISPSVMIEKIAPGEGIRYTATVYGGEKLKNGEVVLRVTVAAGDYSECDWQEFSLPTQKRGR